MNEKREYPRHKCKIDVEFEFHEGDPNEIDVETDTPKKGKGIIVDLSKGGLFIISNSRVCVDMPVKINFQTKVKQNDINGTIIRTGLRKNNPSEVAQKIKNLKVKGDAYIAVRFDNPLEDIDEKVL